MQSVNEQIRPFALVTQGTEGQTAKHSHPDTQRNGDVGFRQLPAKNLQVPRSLRRKVGNACETHALATQDLAWEPGQIPGPDVFGRFKPRSGPGMANNEGLSIFIPQCQGAAVESEGFADGLLGRLDLTIQVIGIQDNQPG